MGSFLPHCLCLLCHNTAWLSTTAQPELHSLLQAPETLVTQKMLLLRRASGVVQLRSDPEENPVDRWHHTKTFFRPSAFPHPQWPAPKPPYIPYLSPITLGLLLLLLFLEMLFATQQPFLLQRPKGMYPEEEVQSLGAVAEGHEEGAVCGKDSHSAGGAAHCCLPCPPPTGLAGQHRDWRKREHPTEQRDTTSPARGGNRQHLTRMRHVGQEKDKMLDLAGAW